MEDRLSPYLYLEFSDLHADAYGKDRVPGILERDGVERASWWTNLRPHRKEFPRNVPEFSTLGLFEVSDAFSPPELTDATRALRFARTPRPAQGNLSGKPTLGLEFVLVSPKADVGAQELRDWADYIHIRHIAASSVPGFTMITPYENMAREGPRFLHLYELDTPDAEEAFQIMTPKTIERIGGPGTPAFREWATHPQLEIDYVNTFARAGAASR